jgi:hypothetical protein
VYFEKNFQAYYNAGVEVVNSGVVGLSPGVNTSIVSYNASAVKIYNATSSLERFGKQKYFLLHYKTLDADVVVVNSEFVGLATGKLKN